SPSTVRTSAACNRISGPAPDCRSADTGIRRSGCRRPPRCSGYAYHLTARQAAAYEQTVRFSHLVRSPNEEEFAKYERAIAKEQRAYLDAWGALDLKSMAAKRDALPPFSDSVLAKESLLHWYESIYSQFSSVSHYDRYSIELLGIRPAPDGTLVLAAQPHWQSSHQWPLPARRRSGKRR